MTEKANQSRKDFWAYIQVLFKMSRPSQLLAISLVSGWGCAVALAREGTFSQTNFLVGFLALIFTSVSIHYANEYADYETDRLTVRTPFSGGSGALPESGVPRKTALVSAWVALILGAGIAVGGVLDNSISFISLIFLGLGGFFGWMYSLKPLALAWNGWGELTNAALGGILLPAYAYTAHTRTIDWSALLTFLPFGMLVFVNLLATTWPDRKADAAVGKFTLATRWSVTRLRVLHAGAAFGAILISLLLAGVVLPPVVVLSGLLVIPILAWSVIAYTRSFSPFPSVAAMVLFLLAQLTGWLITIA